MNADSPIVITTANNLEGLLLDEAAALGLSAASQTRGAVQGAADRDTIYRILLGSRLASRVLLPLTTAPAADADAFYRALRAFPWEAYLAYPLRLAVQCHGRSDGIRHTRFGSQRVKDAIADRARAAGQSVEVDLEAPDARISVRLRNDRAELALDLAGDSLHRRGYRRDRGEAPLKEPLAAAILMRAGWPARAADSRTLFDPCCGAGTLLAEGGMMAADLAPGLLRERFGLNGWRHHSEADWQRSRAAATQRVIRDPEALPELVGHDSDPAAVRAAAANLERIGLACTTTLRVGDAHADDPPWPEGPGVMVTNPPYGQRLRNGDEAESLYARLGERARRELPGWRMAVFSDRSQHLAALGLQSRRVYKLLNGQLACRLGIYDIHAATQPAPAKPHHPAPPELRNRLGKNLKHLARWRRREGIGAYRIYDAEIPEYPVTIDVYEGEDETRARIGAYEPPAHLPRRKAEARRRAVVAAVAEALSLPEASIHTVAPAHDETNRPTETPGPLVIQEGPARYQVDPAARCDTGLSLAQRGLRERVRRQIPGQRFLNLAAGNGAATVQAALAGASATTSVDPTAESAAWLRAHLALNGAAGAAEHEIITANVPDWLQRSGAAERRWDSVLLDTACHSVGHGDNASPAALVRSALSVMAPGGCLTIVATEPAVELSADAVAPFALHEISRRLVPPDFARGPTPFRCWLVQDTANATDEPVPTLSRHGSPDAATPFKGRR
jgi:23S rRNA (guanine2445-N2)-methyltransferase / 23S rRNA (guanine2069-N7)-methyltransferase